PQCPTRRPSDLGPSRRSVPAFRGVAPPDGDQPDLLCCAADHGAPHLAARRAFHQLGRRHRVPAAADRLSDPPDADRRHGHRPAVRHSRPVLPTPRRRHPPPQRAATELSRPLVESLIAFAVLIVLIFLRLPLAFAMGTVGFFGYYVLTGNWNASEAMAARRIVETVQDYSLSVIPLFVLMGNLV